MIHEHCRTYFSTAPHRCAHCGMWWCPRCRTWFRAPEKAVRAQLSEDGERD